MARLANLICIGSLLLAITSAVAARAFTPLDLVTLPSIGTVSPSPDGKLVVFAKSKYDELENKSTKNLHILELATDVIDAVTQPSFYAKQDNAFFLSNTHIAYLNSSDDGTAIWVLDVSNFENEPYRLTDYPVDIAHLKFSHSSKLLAFSAAVHKDGTLQGAADADKKAKERKDTALVYDQLMVRHWDTFVPDKKQNIFVVQLAFDDGKWAVAGEPINLLARSGLESPVLPFGGANDFNFSPDGQELVFVAKKPARDFAWQTSQYIYLVPTTGDYSPVAINSDIPGASSRPTYAPDGLTIAYLQMYVPQYEADRNRIVLYDRAMQSRVVLTESWDRSPSSLAWSVDSDGLFVTAQDKGHVKIFSVDALTGKVFEITNSHSASGISVLSRFALIFSLSSFTSPSQIYTIESAASLSLSPASSPFTFRQRSDLYASLISPIELTEPEEFWFTGAQDHPVHGWLIRPPKFDPTVRYPLAFLIHGGPQGAWNDAWSTRWNPAAFAGAGFVVVAINPTGSTGYGQKFTDAIRRNWGSLPYVDLDHGLTYVLKNFTFVDPEKVAGLGASYGGYMVNWINGHSKRFRCLVNHDGVFSTLNTWYTGDELYFPEHEFGGTPFDPIARLTYERFSPANHVRNWRTPTLVIHGGRDYRLVDGEGLATFTALQRQGIPSRLVYFPDENHWVNRPANLLRWHAEVLGWITEWTDKDVGFVYEEVPTENEKLEGRAEGNTRFMMQMPEMQ